MKSINLKATTSDFLRTSLFLNKIRIKNLKIKNGWNQFD